MMPEDNPQQRDSTDPKSLETRFGLVMYGGVSLAIYINGVAREFFRAVRGAGVYKLVKALTDSDVVVDVISGTSAGGINGIMLAYALCNKKDFASCATLWRLDGDIRSLLRSPYRDADGSESLFDSESYYQPRLEAAFREMPDYTEEEGEINSRFPELDLFVTGTDVDGNISTQFDDAGHPINVKDHRSVFLLKHREGRKHPFEPGASVEGPSSPETTYQALAKLARITSCFPAAFSPVHVRGDEPPGNETVDGKLQLWGGLGKDSCFLDGGIIDNKPFTYTIREIFNRSAEREVERKLFYVEPDPEHFDKPDVASRPNFVQAVIASLIGIPSYESIADDLKLLAKHNTKVKQYGRLRSFLEERVAAMGGSPPPISPQDKGLYERCGLIALSERVIEGILKIKGKAELLNKKDREAASALIKAFDEVQEQVRKDICADDDSTDYVPTVLRNFDIYFRQRRLYRAVYKIVEVLRNKKLSPDNEAEVNRYTNLWRLLNRELELLEIVRVNMERLIDDAPIKWKAGVGEAVGDGGGDDQKLSKEEKQAKLSKEARLVWAVVSEALYRLIGEKGKAAGRLPEAFERVYKEVEAFVADPSAKINGFDADMLGAFNADLKEQIGDAANGIIADIDSNKIREEVEKLSDEERADRSRDFTGILQLTRAFERKVIAELLKPVPGESGQAAKDREAVRSTYFNFQRLDAQMFPIEFVAELYEKDVIETIRISPRDAERGFSNKGLSDKVSGDALYHFGGFFKRSWRSNDILWGRLDSLCQLTETLLTPEKIGRVLETPLLIARARARFFKNSPGAGAEPEWVPTMHPSRLFPHAGKDTQDDLADWLVGLLWKGEPLDRDDFGRTKIARIIEAAQLEILYEDLPGVITDALEEQARWNQFRYPPGLLKSGGRGNNGGGSFDPTVYPPVYLPAGGSLDPFASVLAAAGAASDAMRRFEERPASGATPMDTGVGQFFTKDYRIGSEALMRDMPPLVLMEILSVSLLVMRNCLLKVFSSQAPRIKSHPLYVFGVDLPLRAFNTLVIFMRRVPNSRRWLPVALGALSLVLLVIGIIWPQPIIWTPRADGGGELNTTRFLIFIAGPLVVLTTWGVYLYQGKVVKWTWLRRLRDVLLALMILLPCFVAVAAYLNLYKEAVGGLTPIFDGIPLLSNVSGWLARASVFLSIFLILLAPLIAFAVLARLGKRGRSGTGRLRSLLKKYFSIPDMLAIARRLDLFDAEEVDKLASEIGVFDGEDLKEIASRYGARLEDFRAELQQKFGLADPENSEAYNKRMRKEESKIRYDTVIEVYNEAEKARKRRAYDKLAAELGKIEEERRAALASRLSSGDGDGAGKVTEDAAAKMTAALDDLLEEARSFEERKMNLAYDSIENAQRTDEAVRAGTKLADRIVDTAAERDAGPSVLQRVSAGLGGAKKGKSENRKKRKESETTLTRLEDLMYSINPGAMS